MPRGDIKGRGGLWFLVLTVEYFWAASLRQCARIGLCSGAAAAAEAREAKRRRNAPMKEGTQKHRLLVRFDRYINPFSEPKRENTSVDELHVHVVLFSVFFVALVTYTSIQIHSYATYEQPIRESNSIQQVNEEIAGVYEVAVYVCGVERVRWEYSDTNCATKFNSTNVPPRVDARLLNQTTGMPLNVTEIYNQGVPSETTVDGLLTCNDSHAIGDLFQIRVPLCYTDQGFTTGTVLSALVREGNPNDDIGVRLYCRQGAQCAVAVQEENSEIMYTFSRNSSETASMGAHHSIVTIARIIRSDLVGASSGTAFVTMSVDTTSSGLPGVTLQASTLRFLERRFRDGTREIGLLFLLSSIGGAAQLLLTTLSLSALACIAIWKYFIRPSRPLSRGERLARIQPPAPSTELMESEGLK